MRLIASLILLFVGVSLVGHMTQASAKRWGPSLTLGCGAILTQSAVLTQDLNCPDSTGFALQVIGDGITLDGNGYKIVAPLASAGVYVHGASDTVQNITVNGAAIYGLYVFDSPGVSVLNNDFSGNQIGIELYAQNTVMTGVVVQDNVARVNTVFGVRTAQDGAGSIVNPQIMGNDFSLSGSFAMAIGATSFELAGTANNTLSDSLNGINLSVGDFYVHDLSLSSQAILQSQIFVADATSAKIQNVDVSVQTVAPPSNSIAAPAGSHVGINLYQVGSFSLSTVNTTGNDVGVLVATEQGVSSNGAIASCQFAQNTTAGIALVSYDGTPWGDIQFMGNGFDEAAGVSQLLMRNDASLNQKVGTTFVTGVEFERGTFRRSGSR
jgi:hypothetical protein